MLFQIQLEDRAKQFDIFAFEVVITVTEYHFQSFIYFYTLSVGFPLNDDLLGYVVLSQEGNFLLNILIKSIKLFEIVKLISSLTFCKIFKDRHCVYTLEAPRLFVRHLFVLYSNRLLLPRY